MCRVFSSLMLVFVAVLQTQWTTVAGSPASCKNPSPYYGQLIGNPVAFKCPGNKNGQCVAAVMTLCNLGNTGTWKKGVKVMSNCANIPKNTAIATFEANGGTTYQGHAAIFQSCNNNGIQVNNFHCRNDKKNLTYPSGSRPVVWSTFSPTCHKNWRFRCF